MDENQNINSMPTSPNPNPQFDADKSTILKTELKEKKTGLFGRLQQKWQNHILENKRKALRRKGFSEEEIEEQLKAPSLSRLRDIKPQETQAQKMEK